MNPDRKNRAIDGLARCLAACAAIVLFHAGVVDAQNTVVLRRADSFNVINDKVREVIGNVEFQQGNVDVTCDKAIQYLAENRVELRGNVHVVQDTVTLTAPHGFYDGNSKTAYGDGGVTLNNRHMTITADSGIYATEKKIAYFHRNMMVVDSASVLLAHDGTYDQTTHKAECFGNVKVHSTSDNTTVYGDVLEHYDSTRYTRIPVNPRLVQFDTTGREIDTLIIVSKLMESYDDSIKRFIATDSVRLTRGRTAAIAGRGTYYSGRNRIVLERLPVVWYEDNQLTGDTITLTMKHRQLEYVFVHGNAFAVTKGDSLTTTRFNQLSGRDLTMEFANGKLARMIVEKTAISLYYLYQENKPDGVNKSSGDKIVMSFSNGQLQKISIPGGPEGVYYPEKLVRGREIEYNLAGFRLITPRPAFRFIGNTIIESNHD